VVDDLVGRLARRLGRNGADALGAWLDVVFPPRCAGCGRLGSHFCAACARSLRPVKPPWCDSCGASVVAGARCADCRLDPLPLGAVRSAGAFEGPLRQAIHRLKYRGRRAAAPRLADLLRAPFALLPLDGAHPSDPVVVPVPLHGERERERGYNQAALLARPLAAHLGLRYEPRALRRVRPTATQVGLPRPQRRDNVRGAFVAGGVRGWPIVLVDDVTTTGSTLGSAAEACLAAGAQGVLAVTLARGHVARDGPPGQDRSPGVFTAGKGWGRGRAP
jgi:ComF family protein